jgi:acyl phosphate:glycerol-3-phosphate acyltransferase
VTRRRRRPARSARPRAATVVGLAWLAGSIPFSNLAARARAGVDLREVGSGTVSGTALHEVAGFGPLAVAGVCDIAKGAVGPLLAGRDRPMLAAVSGAAGVAGHNWSPWLGGAGGRGISVAMGSFLVHAWPGTVVLATGLAAGRLCRQTGLGSFVADVALTPVLAKTQGRTGLVAGAGVAGVMLAKRVAGNTSPERPDMQTYVHRLLFDRDHGGPPEAIARGPRGRVPRPPVRERRFRMSGRSEGQKQ